MTGLCTCRNEGADAMYGIGVRIFNKTRSGARCSTCGLSLMMRGGEVANKKKRMSAKALREKQKQKEN